MRVVSRRDDVAVADGVVGPADDHLSPTQVADHLLGLPFGLSRPPARVDNSVEVLDNECAEGTSSRK